MDLGVDAEGHPVVSDREPLSSRWMGAGAVMYDAWTGKSTPVCFGGFFAGVTAARIVGCWHNGFQFLEEGAGNLEDGDTAGIALSWSFDSISQIFVEGKRRGRRFEPAGIRVFGGNRGTYFILEAVMPANAQWLGTRERNPRVQYIAFAKAVSQAWARYALQQEPSNRADVESIASGSEDGWRMIESPFNDGDVALVIGL